MSGRFIHAAPFLFLRFMKKILLILGIVFLVHQANAQATKQTEHLEQIWLGVYSQARFSNHWGTWVDLHLRTKDDFVDNLSQTIARVGLTYYANDDLKFTLGYAFVNIFPADNHKQISQPEQRIWQQMQWHTKGKKTRTMQWLRLEERYRRRIANDSTLAEGYNFNFRLRYNYLFQVPITSKGFSPGGLAFVLNDEVHLNFGEEIVYNYFDQNRFFVGLSYQTGKMSNLQFGYMNVFQQLAAGNRYKVINAARVFFFQNFDFRKK